MIVKFEVRRSLGFGGGGWAVFYAREISPRKLARVAFLPSSLARLFLLSKAHHKYFHE